MNQVVDLRAKRRGRSSESMVSVLRWPSTGSADVFEMFSAREIGRFGRPAPASSAAGGAENLLLVSASRRTSPEPPAVLLSLVNTSPWQAVRLSMKLAGRKPTSIAGTIVTAPPLGPRDAAAPPWPATSAAAQPTAFRGAHLRGKIVDVTVPARSVVVLTVRQPCLVAVRPGSDRRPRVV